MTSKNPDIRFKGFAEAWEQRKLGRVTSSYSGGTPSAGNKSYYGGEIPFIRSAEINSDSTELFLTDDGLNNSSAKMVQVGYILYALYGATSGEVGISQINGAINQAILAIKPNDDYNSQFIMQWLRFQKQKIIDKYLQGGQGNLSGSIVKDLQIKFPNHDEQTRMGTFFEQLDKTIALHQHELTLLKQRKKAFLQKMFPTKEKKVPEIRFTEFNNDWKDRKLSDGMTKYTDRVIIDEETIYKQVSVKNIGEIVLRGEKLGSKIGRKRQARVNLDEHPNTLIFTRQTIEQGGIGFAPIETNGAIVTENMPTIDINTRVFDKEYLLSFFKTVIFRQKVILPNIEGGTAQIAIHEDNILKSEILVPIITEQTKTGNFFKQLDESISLQEQKLSSLIQMKKAFLQKMFV